MRIYTKMYDAAREIERELKEMGIHYSSTSVQNQQLDAEKAETIELQHYGFQISAPQLDNEDLAKTLHYRTPEQPGESLISYIGQEFEDRMKASYDFITNADMNPGKSWEHRGSMWRQFLKASPRQHFDYTYYERMAPQWEQVFKNLKKPGSRHAIISFWDGIDSSCDAMGADLNNAGSDKRVPCSMFYQFMERDKKIYMLYVMRSCDFINHFAIDMILARMIHHEVANRMGCAVGTFTMLINSLHMFKKDLKNETF